MNKEALKIPWRNSLSRFSEELSMELSLIEICTLRSQIESEFVQVHLLSKYSMSRHISRFWLEAERQNILSFFRRKATENFIRTSLHYFINIVFVQEAQRDLAE